MPTVVRVFLPSIWPRLATALLFLALGCGGREADSSVPSEAEIGRLDKKELEARFAAIEARLLEEGAGGARVEARVEAGHAALVAFSKTSDSSFARRARRWSSAGVVPEASASVRCKARLDLVELERALSDLEAARVGLALALAEISEDSPCAERAAELARELGVTAAPNPNAVAAEVEEVRGARRRLGPVVVLDPGHGGDEFGASVEGARESRIVLDIAKRAAAALSSRVPGVNVVLTRSTDDEVSLEQRASLANSLDADVFVSIHVNDADVPVVTGGITTFVLDVGNETQARRLAARENATTTDRVSGLSVLLAGIHRESQVAGSRLLAESVHGSALASARRTFPRLPDRGIRASQFYVLVGTRMPSILVECGFMTRPEELTALRTVAYRRTLGEGIADGVARYLRAQ